MSFALVSAARMREMDRRTILAEGIPGLRLMERAGRGLLHSVSARVPDIHRRRVAILCGKGNNGGDGLVLARLLRARGLWPRVLLAVPLAELEGDAAVNASRALEMGLTLEPAGARERAWLRTLREDDLVIDALLGTGLTGPARDPVRGWIEAINDTRARVASVDLPSGLSADEPETDGPVVRASWTATMAYPKRSFPFVPARGQVGVVDVLDIGFSRDVEAEIGVDARLAEPEDIAALLPRPGAATHKGDWGKLLVVGGSPGLSGAPVLAAQAALRLGAGLVRIATPRSLAPIFESISRETMVLPLPEGESGQLLASGADRLLSGFGDWDAMVLGPGLGRFPESDRLVLKLLGGWRGPLVIDADGLNALAAFGPDSWVPRAREVRAAGERGGLVLTPHAGEMSRLLGRPIAEIKQDPIGTARRSAERWGVTLVLKGAPTVIATADGDVWVNPTGNAGLATGGSGDVLAGMIGALLGQRSTGSTAALLGNYLHGLSADLATVGIAERALLPGDVIDTLPRALAHAARAEASPRFLWRRIACRD